MSPVTVSPSLKWTRNIQDYYMSKEFIMKKYDEMVMKS